MASRIVMWPAKQPKKDTPGFVYALEFSSGVVKVGRATNYKARQRQHYVNAKVHGHRIIDSWCVWAADGQKWAEQQAISVACALPATAQPAGIGSLEWWLGVNFDQLIEELEKELGRGTRRTEFPDLYREDWLAQIERERLEGQAQAA